MADEETDRSDSSITASPVQQNEDVGGQQFPANQNVPVQTAPVPPQSQTAASLPSSPQTVGSFKNLPRTRAPFQSPVQTAGRVSLSHLAKETPSSSESALTVLSLGPIPPLSHVPPLAQNASSVSHFPLNVTVSQPFSSDQLVSGSRGSVLAQASNASAFQPFQKRHATQPLPTCGRAVRGRIDPSVPASAHATPPPVAYPTQTAPVPPQAQIADFLPYPAQIARPGLRLATETPLISQELNRTRPLGVPKCPICRMDLARDPSISTMPCGHRFHTLCLNFSPAAASLLPHVLLPPCPICGRRWR